MGKVPMRGEGTLDWNERDEKVRSTAESKVALFGGRLSPRACGAETERQTEKRSYWVKTINRIW